LTFLDFEREFAPPGAAKHASTHSEANSHMHERGGDQAAQFRDDLAHFGETQKVNIILHMTLFLVDSFFFS
jgi:hypothetical protein